MSVSSENTNKNGALPPNTATRVTSVDDPALGAILSGIEAGALERERDRIHPFEQIELLRRTGLTALRIPAENGGLGASLRDSFRFVLALGEADANVAHILRNHFLFVERYARISADGSHRHWAKLIADGAVFALASNEPNKPVAGSSDSKAGLVRKGDNFVLNTVKVYSTGVYYADYAIVRVLDEHGRPASALIPTTRDGVVRHDDWDGFGQRLTGSGTTEFHDVVVEPHEVVVDDRFNYQRHYFSTHPQLFLTTVIAGILKAIARDGVREVKRRKRNFAHAPHPVPAEDSVLQQALGDIISRGFAAESTVLAAADSLEKSFNALEAGQEYQALAHQASLHAAAAKVIVDELTISSASRLFDLGGASSTLRSLNLDRHWRNARTVASHNPASYKALAIGRYALTDVPLTSQAFF